MLELSVQGAHALEGHLDDPRAQQMYGALHLNAALASAAMRRGDDATDHLNEAGAIAERVGPDGRGFGNLYFGSGSPAWPQSLGIARRGDDLVRLPGLAQFHNAAHRDLFGGRRSSATVTGKI
ncbi:MAG TPA: hypothetical protein VGJ13_17480, partial [Pseudonocardiaceae bacterium]